MKAFHGTTVAASKTRGEIDTLLKRHGAEALRWTEFSDRVLLEFRVPSGDFAIGTTFDKGDCRTPEQNQRQVMRALHWYIKAKLDAVDFGLEDMVRAFMPYMITGPNRTLGDDVMERVEQRQLGEKIALLPEGK